MYFIFFIFIMMGNFILLHSLERLPAGYTISYGNPQAPIKMREYFSFVCPHCIALFRLDFKKIKEEFVQTNQIYWEFHPVPQDLATVQAMICLRDLNEKQKQLFLEVILEEVDIENPSLTPLLMQKAMEILGKPIPSLLEKEFISESAAFKDAFDFVKQEDSITAIPSLEINSRIYREEVPEYNFIVEKMHELKGH